jgi:glyoxylase-like metal-dependent hydrolase (beta-lactamase superfamily II)
VDGTDRPAQPAVDGVTRIAVPIGVNNIESVNVYAIADADRITLVDCGIWRPEPDQIEDGNLERGLNAAGYALRDVSRIIVTHAHIDHYGMAGRLLELTGAELWMHAMTWPTSPTCAGPAGWNGGCAPTASTSGTPQTIEAG